MQPTASCKQPATLQLVVLQAYYYRPYPFHKLAFLSRSESHLTNPSSHLRTTRRLLAQQLVRLPWRRAPARLAQLQPPFTPGLTQPAPRSPRPGRLPPSFTVPASLLPSPYCQPLGHHRS
eukprot:scaffold64459_cov58-Phaeocystis_antarctica.AAC.2